MKLFLFFKYELIQIANFDTQLKSNLEILSKFKRNLNCLPYLDTNLIEKVISGLDESIQHSVSDPFLYYAEFNPSVVEELLTSTLKGIQIHWTTDLLDRDQFWDAEERRWEREKHISCVTQVLPKFGPQIAESILINHFEDSNIRTVCVEIIKASATSLDENLVLPMLENKNFPNGHAHILDLLEYYPSQTGRKAILDFSYDKLSLFREKNDPEFVDKELNYAIIVSGLLAKKIGCTDDYLTFLHELIQEPKNGKKLRIAGLTAIGIGGYTQFSKSVREIYHSDEVAEEGISLWFSPPFPLKSKAFATLISFGDRPALKDLYAQIRDMDHRNFQYEVIYETLAWSFHNREVVLNLIDEFTVLYRDDSTSYKAKSFWTFASWTVENGYKNFIPDLRTDAKIMGYSLLILSYQPAFKEQLVNKLTMNISLDKEFERDDYYIPQLIQSILRLIDMDEQSFSKKFSEDLEGMNNGVDFIISRIKDLNNKKL